VSVLLLPNTGAGQLLHQEGLLVGAADEVMPTDRGLAVLESRAGGIPAAKPIASSQETSRQGSVDGLADHRLQDAVLVVA
jgi:hypothetical protein